MADTASLLVTFLVTRDGERGHPMDTLIKRVDLADDGAPTTATLERLTESIVREVIQKQQLIQRQQRWPAMDDLAWVPPHLIGIAGLTDQTTDPTHGVQFAVLDPDGTHHAYGDQNWVAYGGCLRLEHPGGRIQRRPITITYGEWEDHG